MPSLFPPLSSIGPYGIFCWVQLLPNFSSAMSRAVFPGVQGKEGCRPQAVCRLPRRSEFPLTLRLRQSPFTKDDWGLTYANKTREAHGLVGRPCYEIPRVTQWS